MPHKKILWVGDPAALSLAALETLKSLAFDVVYPASGEQALDQTPPDPAIDLVLLDLDSDGIQLWQAFVQQHHLPALFLTQRTGPAAALTLRALSGWGCLSAAAGPFEWQSALEMTFALFEARQKLRESEDQAQVVPDRREHRKHSERSEHSQRTDQREWSEQAQLELRESEERLQQIASALRVGIWIREVSTRKVLYVNPAFEEILGLPRQDFYDDPDVFFNHIHPEDVKLIRKGEIGRSAEHRIVRPDGSIRWVWGRNFSVYNAAGQVYRIVSIVEDITERKQVEEELKVAYGRLQTQMDEIQSLQSILRDQAIRDPLTGLFNRRYYNDMLERELRRAQREEYPVGLVMIDIDDFKQVNDRFGHPAGDEVLQRLAQHLNEVTRASDIVCRYAGDEFLLLLPKLPPQAAFQRAEMLRRSFHNLKVFYNDSEIQITLSVGVAIFPLHGTTSQDLLAAADHAMYAAKAKGKDCVVLWEGK